MACVQLNQHLFDEPKARVRPLHCQLAVCEVPGHMGVAPHEAEPRVPVEEARPDACCMVRSTCTGPQEPWKFPVADGVVQCVQLP